MEGSCAIDTDKDGWGAFEFVKQRGWETGNAELQDYLPEQAKVEKDGVHLVLLKAGGNRYVSGKIKSRKSLCELAPSGGSLEITVSGPTRRFSDGSERSNAPGLWPAIWLIPSGGGWPMFGEIDLMELMEFRGKSSSAFSTLHFGPRVGVDAIYDGHWGYKVGSYRWPASVLRFDFSRELDRSWRLSLSVDGNQEWSIVTNRGPNGFENFQHGKNFSKASASDFEPGAPGDPAVILQRAFDNPKVGMHITANLAFGGTPWNVDQLVDRGLASAELVIHRVRLVRGGNMTLPPLIQPIAPTPAPLAPLTPPVPPEPASSDSSKIQGPFSMMLGSGWDSASIDGTKLHVDRNKGHCIPINFDTKAIVNIELSTTDKDIVAFQMMLTSDGLVGPSPSIAGIYVHEGRYLQVYSR